MHKLYDYMKWININGGIVGKYLLNRRNIALLEVCLVSLLQIFVLWFREAYLTYFKCSVFWHLSFPVFMMSIALCFIILTKRSLWVYGFIPKSLCFTLKWSVIIMAIFILPTIISIVMSGIFSVVKFVKWSLLDIVWNVVYLMIFVGLIEEAYFRGYVQSRLNEVFEKRWRKLVFKVWEVNYGISLLLTSIIFALMHIIHYWNPLTSRWEPVWWMPIHILGCFLYGCLAGALREASSNIYIPASLHGSIMVAYTFLSIYTNEIILNVSLFISWFIFFYFLHLFFHESKNIR